MLVFRPADEKENEAAYEAVLDGVNCGRVEFEYSGYRMKYTAVSCADDIVTEGLLRSSMNYCANRGVYACEIGADMLSPAAKRLGFRESELIVDIPDALTSTSCSCGDNRTKPE